MSTKYLDSSGLAYFWGKLKARFQDKLVSGTNIKTINNMSLLGNGNIDIIADDTIAFYRKVENVYTTQSANETTIPVGISGLRSIDMLLVNINGLDLAEGVDFNRSGTNIVLTTPISAIGQAVHFTALRAVSASTQDYSVLKGDDGVVQDVLQNGVSVLGQDGIARVVSGTSDYDSLTNRPQINSVTLTGNKSLVDLGFLDMFYPVGSYYETSDSSFDPNTAWGGTWVKETEGQVHVSSGSNYAVNGANSNTSDGGSKDAVVVTHQHEPNDWIVVTNKNYVSAGDKILAGSSGSFSAKANASKNDDKYISKAPSNAVSGTDKNMPPYIVVHRWHRTA